jgi:pimeloyl-ACP methyl ester carboxylesterase
LAVPGASIHWQSTGVGLPLVLIHAGIADQTMWDEDVAALAAGHRVVTFDLRGYGRSASTDEPFSNRADIAALLDALGFDRVALLGCSGGGRVALDFTLERPTRVSALVLVAAGISGFAHDETAEERALSESEEASWEARDWPALADLDVQVWVDGVGQSHARVPAPIRERVRAMALGNYEAGYAEGQPIALDPPAADRLSEVRVPTLVIDGDLDASGVTAAAAALVRGIPGARRVTLPGVAHMVNLERPADFHRLVLGFLAEAGL